MKAVVQRVSRAAVRVDGEVVGRTGAGLLVFLGVMKGDSEREACLLAGRIAGFRCFPDARGRMGVAALEAGAGMLVISQFTLAADGRKGRRPSFDAAAPPAVAEPLYESFAAHLAGAGLAVERGVFGAKMEVELVNDGPVTFVLEQSPEPGRPSQVLT